MRSSTKSLLRRLDPQRSIEVPVLNDLQEAIIGRYEPAVRREVRRLMRISPRFADIALVFPGALHALGSGHGSLDERRQAIGLIEEGAPLKVVARTLGLPYWLRRLPAEAFVGPIGTLPNGETFARRIANRMPPPDAASSFWLDSVCFATRACHEDFALWLAEQPIFSEPGDAERLFCVLSAYAWFSGHPYARAHGLIVVPWRPEIAFDTALCAAKSWFNRVRLMLQVTPGVIDDFWLSPGCVNGYTIVPLTSAREILDEANAMQNCADQYADRLVRDRCRLFGIRKGASRVATMEIGAHPREAGFLAINQLKARHNMPATLEVWQAAHGWMAQQPVLKRLPSLGSPDRPVDNSVWRDLMADYRRHKGGAIWLPETLTIPGLGMIDADMTDLARRGCVSSWLFT
jgi:hypothetical protein